MSTLIFIISLAILLLGYRIYGSFVERFFEIDLNRKTPAHTKYDGIDYVPARSWWVLFSHHFASIAGAGPIVGPVLAFMYWGWLGVLLWILFGTIFMGAVHDFGALFISIRENGNSFGQVAQKYISKKASIVLLVFLWLALVLVISVFADICSRSFINEPRIVLPSLGLIPVALLIGFLMSRLRLNLAFSTLLGIGFLVVFVIVGKSWPIVFGGRNPYLAWLSILFVYSFFASVIPVDILLAPRDYISSFLLFFGILVAALAIVINLQPLDRVTTLHLSSAKGPIFPVMFIMVACGAISGFHSLVSSGTTSKQLSNERDAKRIGYGAMVLEAILAVIALICVVFGVADIPEGTTPIGVFGIGFGKIVFFLGDYAKFVAIIMVNAFILTTLDTATRITRLLTQELLGLKNKYWATLISVGSAGLLLFSGTFDTLWPMFGATNQLVAGLSLLVVSGYLSAKGKNNKITLIPAILMFFITFIFLFRQMAVFFSEKNYLLSLISVILVFLGAFIVKEFIKKRKEYA
ncbi:MAG: carbon starvation protein A [Candidatus Omnitrophica bacterium]|nr:carbon starvation protein A [Candidatus Omnitrophota bacterium]